MAKHFKRNSNSKSTACGLRIRQGLPLAKTDSQVSCLGCIRSGAIWGAQQDKLRAEGKPYGAMWDEFPHMHNCP